MVAASLRREFLPNYPDADERGASLARLYPGRQACRDRTLLLVSGGERAGDEATLEKARQAMEAGATGLIFGRSVRQGEHFESPRFVARLKEILAKHPSS